MRVPVDCGVGGDARLVCYNNFHELSQLLSFFLSESLAVGFA